MSTSLLTHNDLDALGCYLALSQKFNFENIFNTNYSNFNEIFNQIKNCQSENLIIADVSMSTFKNELIEMSKKFKKIILIDHHMYDDTYFNDLPKNIIIVYNIDKCACKSCYELVKKDNDKLLKLIDFINVFDIWQSHHKDFYNSLILNDFFWKVSEKLSFIEIANLFRNSFYNYEKILLKYSKSYLENCLKTIKDFEKRGIIQRSKSISITLNDAFFNNFVYDEFNKGQHFVICFKFNYVKIRISENACSDTIKTNIKNILCNGDKIGHLNAFSYKIKDASTETILSEAQRIVRVINENFK